MLGRRELDVPGHVADASVFQGGSLVASMLTYICHLVKYRSRCMRYGQSMQAVFDGYGTSGVLSSPVHVDAVHAIIGI